MRRSIAGARALVTGASGGLGRALATELARQGANVVLLARREDKLRAVAEEIAAFKKTHSTLTPALSQEERELVGRAEIVVGDVTSPTARRAALDAAQAAFGGLDILVNNAGVGAIGRFDAADLNRTREVFETNFFAPVELTREALPLLKAGRQPIIVNIGSILGHRATPQNSAYCASKFALRGWTESIRVELAAEGIEVLLASLGPTSTDFWDHLVERQGDVPWTTSLAMPAEVAARRIVRAMARDRREIIPGFRAHWFVRLSRHFPRLFDRILRRYA
jgi:short-subunit dehydrogenase